MQRQYPDSPCFNRTSVVRLTGDLRAELLEESLGGLLRRHAVLRAAIDDRQGVPYQRIMPCGSFSLRTEDLSAQDAPEETALRAVKAEAMLPIDLRRPPLWRIRLFRLRPGEHLLAFVIHHIAVDAWSMQLLLGDLAARYASLAGGGKTGPDDPSRQYFEYASDQRTKAEKGGFAEDAAYWRERLAGEPVPLQYPWDRPRGAEASHRGGLHVMELSGDCSDRLTCLCRAERATPFMFLFAAFQALLSRYAGQDDIVTGIPVAGRRSVETEKAVGLFVNTLPVRTTLWDGCTFREWLACVRRSLLEAYDHQDIPFEKLIAEMSPERSLAYHPLYQVMFNMHNVPAAITDGPGLHMEEIPFDDGNVLLDLEMTAEEIRGAFRFQIKYNRALLEPSSALGLAGSYRTLLEGVLADIDQPVARIPLLAENEIRRQLFGWNRTGMTYPRDKTIVQLFHETVRETPDAAAIDTMSGIVTYQELDNRSDLLAACLRRMGVVRNVPAGIALNRSADYVTAMLAILKAGGAYVPLDVGMPSERLGILIRDAGMPVIVTRREWVGKLKDGVRLFLLDDPEHMPDGAPAPIPAINNTPDDLAYVMYTSGSTGAPKGVCIPHRGVVRLAKGAGWAVPDHRQIILQFSTMAFDASTFEVWGSLLNGAVLVIPPAGINLMDELGAIIRSRGVTMMFMTTELFHLMADRGADDLNTLKRLIVGGDVLSAAHAREFVRSAPGCALVNAYGPTENTTFTTCYPIGSDTDFTRPIPIGKPISNTRAYILDAQDNPVPPRVIGELCIAGDGLAAGYLHDETRTGEKFMRLDLPGLSGERVYRSGDLARFLPDGNIEFMGRNDRQLKIRGFRVEPAEIERALRLHPNVRQAAVRTALDGPSGKSLITCVVLRERGITVLEDIKSFLEDRLPEYMVPSRFAAMDSLPLTPSGKLDALSLPQDGGQAALPAVAPPGNDSERRMAAIWERLGLGCAGVTDDFFSLGGHSLLALRLTAAIEKEFGRKLPVSAVFRLRTIKRLVQELGEHPSEDIRTILVSIAPPGSGPPLFCIHGMDGDVFGYWNIARHLAADQGVYGVGWRGDPDKPLASVEELAASHVREIVQLLPDGPYCLCGYSYGGIVAFEIARQLSISGRETALLAILDTSSILRKKSVWARAVLHIRHAASLPRGKRMPYLRERIGNARQEFRVRRDEARSARCDGAPPTGVGPMEQLHIALRRYRPSAYQGSMVLFRADEGSVFRIEEDNFYGWGRYIGGGIRTCDLPGSHQTMLQEPHVKMLAGQLQQYINEIRHG